MEEIWNDVKNSLKEHIPGHSFRMWIEPIKFYQNRDGNMILSCPNFYSKKRVQDYYGSIIESAVVKTLGKTCDISIIASSGKETVQTKNNGNTQLALPTMSVQPHSGRLLRKDFTFDQFVVGDNNDFAYSASLSLASRQGTHQRSLFLLSNTGMGKSHLSQAIGHHILTESPSERVYYTTAEDFSNEMVHAFRHDSIEEFKGKYRSGCDVLLIEDVHYLSGKDRTQIELAMTFDSLFEAEKKIIFSGCYLPSEIPKLNDKLKSCMSCGLISNIEPPNFRTRIRIIQKKSAARNISIPAQVIDYLAAELTEDVRQLESGLVGVHAKSSLLGMPVDLDLAKSVVKNIIRQRKNITINTVKKLVSKYYKVSVKEIISRSRKQGIVRPRQIAIYLSRKYTDSPLETIGKSFNRYHATALHSIAAIEKGIKENISLRKQVKYLSNKLDKGTF